MIAYTITAKPTTDRIFLARWLRSITVQLTVPRTLQMADDLLAGEDFEFYLSDQTAASAPSGVKLVPVVFESEYDEYDEVQAGYIALRDKGAAGDAEAAIAYCKLEAEGRVNHAAMG
jgi:hypothetical protein